MLKLKECVLKLPWPINIPCIWKNYEPYRQEVTLLRWQLASRIRTEQISILILFARCQKTCMTYIIAVRIAENSDDGQRNCPKHVEFYSKNKFEKLLLLVGFIIRIFYDELSHESQIFFLNLCASTYSPFNTNIFSETHRVILHFAFYIYCSFKFTVTALFIQILKSFFEVWFSRFFSRGL